MTKNKIPHLLFERGRYYYQRRVPIRFQSAVGHKKWREPVGASFPEAVDRVRELTKRHDAFLEALKNPIEFRTAKTKVRRANEEATIIRDDRLDAEYELWLANEGLDDDAHFGLDQTSIEQREAVAANPCENAKKQMRALEKERLPAPDPDFLCKLIDAMQPASASSTSITLAPYPEYRKLVADASNEVRKRINFQKLMPEPIDDDEYHDRLLDILRQHLASQATRLEDQDEQDEFDFLRQKLERKIARVARNPDILSKIAERYYGFSQIKKNTRNKYRRTMKRLIDQIGDLPLKHLTPDLLRGFRDHLVNRKNLPASIRADFTPIIGMLNYAVDEGLVETSPMSGVRLPKDKRSIEQSKWLPFKPAEMRRILEGVESVWSSEVQGLSTERRMGLQMAVRALTYTAMRPSELMALTPNDIDHRCIRITGGKTKSAVRVIPLHPAISDLTNWVQKGGLDVFNNRTTGLAQTDPVNALRHNFSRLVRNLMDEPITGERQALYSLRSTFQNALRRAGAPIEVRKAIMGHVEHGAIRHYDDGPEFELLRKWVILADPSVD